MILPLLLALSLPGLACQPVHSERIYARDLALVRPEFAGLPPDRPVGFAPLPGLQRVFHADELRRLAQANQIQAEIAGDICFAWKLSVPGREAILVAMKEALTGRQARLEILDQSLSPAPTGDIVFPLSGLSGYSAEPVLWRGYVRYATNRRFDIWARVRVSVRETRVIAKESLRSGEPIREVQLNVQGYEGPLSRQTPLADTSQAAGMTPRFDIPAGAVLTTNMLDKPNEVERGNTVDVIVQTGAAHIQAQGIAEQAGRAGAIITVRNAKTGRKFRARVEDKDKVVVVPGGPVGLVTEDSKS